MGRQAQGFQVFQNHSVSVVASRVRGRVVDAGLLLRQVVRKQVRTGRQTRCSRVARSAGRITARPDKHLESSLRFHEKTQAERGSDRWSYAD